jgi:antitoxin component of MazEF toxin-antitoxin module
MVYTFFSDSIELPSSILSEIDLCEGKRVALSVKGGELLVKPIKSLTDHLLAQSN